MEITNTQTTSGTEELSPGCLQSPTLGPSTPLFRARSTATIAPSVHVNFMSQLLESQTATPPSSRKVPVFLGVPTPKQTTPEEPKPVIIPGPLELQPLKKSRRSNGGDPWRHWEVTHLLTTRHSVHDKLKVWRHQTGVNWLIKFTEACQSGAKEAIARGECGAVPWTRTPDVCRLKLKALEAMHEEVLQAGASTVSGAAGRDLSPKEIADICPYYEYIDAYRGRSPKFFCLSESGPQAGVSATFP